MEKSQTGPRAIALRFGFSVFMLFVALNLPWRYGEFASETLGELSESTSTVHLRSVAENGTIHCGWPWRYAEIASPYAQPPDQWRHWSTLGLCGNLGVATIAALVTAGLAYCSRYLAILGLVGTGLFVVVHGRQELLRDQRQATTLQAFGVVYRTSYLPIRVARLMPSEAQAAFSRIRGVMLMFPTDESVALATSVATLQSLGIRGNLPAANHFADLTDHPRLQQLVVLNAVLAPSHIRMIGLQQDMQYLTLTSCKGLRGALSQLADLPRLRRVELSSSELDIGALSDSPWSRHVEELVLSPQLTGGNDLHLEDWRMLHTLTLRVNRGGIAPGVLNVSLVLMPKLSSLSLISTQKIDLHLINIPRLKEIRIDDTQDQFIGLAIDNAPTSLWLDRLRLRNVASLSRLACYGLDLQGVEIDEAPNLIELTIDAKLYTRQRFQKHPSDQHKAISQLIADLGKCDGPPILNLSTLPLGDIDLSPLAKNQRIRELRLASSGASGGQLEPLLSLPRLHSLDLRGCRITNEEAEKIIDRVVSLRDLLVDGTDFQRIAVVDRDQLVQYIATPVPAASIVRVQRSPQLSSELILGDKLKELNITDARSLKGLSVNGPLPSDATLDGFRDLRYFAIGGENVDDRMCTALWQCPKIDHLTLAYPNLSRRALMQIGGLKELTTLILPGADIDDSVTASWRDLTQLSEVDLSDTKISRGTFQFLMSLKNLQRLSLNYVPIDRRDLKPLVGIAQLIELEVAGVGLEDDLLEAILGRGMLDRLVLSNCELSERSIDLLASPVARSLVFLGVCDCGLTEADVQRILAAHSHLIVDVAGHSLSDDFIDRLSRDNRLVRREDRMGFLRQVGRYNQSGIGGQEPIMDTIPARIDVHRFRNAGLASVR